MGEMLAQSDVCPFCTYQQTCNGCHVHSTLPQIDSFNILRGRWRYSGFLIVSFSYTRWGLLSWSRIRFYRTCKFFSKLSDWQTLTLSVTNCTCIHLPKEASHFLLFTLIGPRLLMLNYHLTAKTKCLLHHTNCNSFLYIVQATEASSGVV